MSTCESDGFFEWIGFFQKIHFIWYCLTTSEQQDIVGSWYNEKLKMLWAAMWTFLRCILNNWMSNTGNDTGNDNNNEPENEIEDNRGEILIHPVNERLI